MEFELYKKEKRIHESTEELETGEMGQRRLPEEKKTRRKEELQENTENEIM